jgi:hypothetical protein
MPYHDIGAWVGPRQFVCYHPACLHGKATKMVLKNESFAKHSEPYARSYWASNNPNIEIIQQLAK